MICKGKEGFFTRPTSRVKKMPFSLRMGIGNKNGGYPSRAAAIKVKPNKMLTLKTKL